MTWIQIVKKRRKKTHLWKIGFINVSLFKTEFSYKIKQRKMHKCLKIKNICGRKLNKYSSFCCFDELLFFCKLHQHNTSIYLGFIHAVDVLIRLFFPPTRNILTQIKWLTLWYKNVHNCTYFTPSLINNKCKLTCAIIEAYVVLFH